MRGAPLFRREGDPGLDTNPRRGFAPPFANVDEVDYDREPTTMARFGADICAAMVDQVAAICLEVE